MAKPFSARTSIHAQRSPSTNHTVREATDYRVFDSNGQVDVLETLKAAGVTQTPSKYQLAVYNEIANTKNNIAVQALAGSGKSTTMVNSMFLLNPADSVLFCAFAKINAEDIAAKCSAAGLSNVTAKTTHSICFKSAMGYAKSKNKGCVVEAKKGHIIADRVAIAAGHSENASHYGNPIVRGNSMIVNDIVTAGAIAMATLTDMGDVSALYRVCQEYDKELEMPETSLPLVAKWAAEMAGDCSMISFDEMLYWVAIGRATPDKFNMIVVDEAQDTNACQMAALLRMVDLANGHGRMVIVGDRNQSIFGFRAAHSRAMDFLAEKMAEQAGAPVSHMPLSICYRCSHTVLEMARKLVPAIEDRPGVDEGKVIAHNPETYGKTMGSLTSGDMVICRVNAPLVSGALACIARGVPAYVQGKDIGYSVKVFIRHAFGITKGSPTLMLTAPEFIAKVTLYANEQADKARAAGYENKAISFEDKRSTAEALIAGIEGAFTIKDVENRIDDVFADDAAGVKFSTVHRAKGAEADRVVILAPELIPHPMAKSNTAREQERNIHYVAITRAKHTLELQPLPSKKEGS
jgi:DNA helicase II / ATP-dependent DNA helicase PcrA